MNSGGANLRVPFTVEADLDLGAAATPWLRTQGADVRIRRGAVPKALSSVEHEGPVWQCAAERVLIRYPWGLGFLVEGGRRISYEADGAFEDLDLRLFLLSTPWLALAMQRGLLPLHASAVAHGKDVYAFTGGSGAGKSTLAAALSARGHALFADDVLLVEPVRSDEARCYGYKDLKLWPEGAALAGVRLGGRTRTTKDYDKRYAEPPHRSPHTCGLLSTLHVLGRASSRVETPAGLSEDLAGRLAVARLYHSIHRRRLAVAILGAKRIAEWLAGLARTVRLRTFLRPMADVHFNRHLELIAAALPHESPRQA